MSDKTLFSLLGADGLRAEANGNIYIRGKYVAQDLEIVELLYDFLMAIRGGPVDTKHLSFAEYQKTPR